MYPLLPHLRGWAGEMIFLFQSPGISPALWGQADDNHPALCPTLHNRKSQQGKCPYVITPTLPRHCGDIQKVISSTLPWLFHGYPRRWGPWIQMTGTIAYEHNLVKLQQICLRTWYYSIKHASWSIGNQREKLLDRCPSIRHAN